jgi:hypothetical protein
MTEAFFPQTGMEKQDPRKVPGRAAFVVALHDVSGLTFRQIGKRLNVCGGRAWQIYHNEKRRQRRVVEKAFPICLMSIENRLRTRGFLRVDGLLIDTAPGCKIESGGST